MNLYLDTEFTDLHFLEKRLISVGLFGEDSTGKPHSFYCELSDTYKRKHCSKFVKDIVLPLLDGKNLLTYDEMILALGKFIEDIQEDVTLVSDAPNWDFSFFTNFLDHETLRPPNIRYIGYCREYMQMDEASAMFREHHALDDCIVNSLMVKQLKKEGYEAIGILRTFY